MTVFENVLVAVQQGAALRRRASYQRAAAVLARAGLTAEANSPAERLGLLQRKRPWYFIVLGAVAIAVAIWAPRGLWGLISEHLHIRLSPVGYWVCPAAQTAGPGWGRLRRPRPDAAPR